MRLGISTPYGEWTEEDQAYYQRQFGSDNAALGAYGGYRIMYLDSRFQITHHDIVIEDTISSTEELKQKIAQIVEERRHEEAMERVRQGKIL